MQITLKRKTKVEKIKKPINQEEDKLSDIDKHPHFGNRKYSNSLPQKSRGLQNKREHRHCRVTATATFCLDVEIASKQTEGNPI